MRPVCERPTLQIGIFSASTCTSAVRKWHNALYCCWRKVSWVPTPSFLRLAAETGDRLQRLSRTQTGQEIKTEPVLNALAFWKTFFFVFFFCSVQLFRDQNKNRLCWVLKALAFRIFFYTECTTLEIKIKTGSVDCVCECVCCCCCLCVLFFVCFCLFIFIAWKTKTIRSLGAIRDPTCMQMCLHQSFKDKPQGGRAVP